MSAPTDNGERCECGGAVRLLQDEDHVWAPGERPIHICTSCGVEVPPVPPPRTEATGAYFTRLIRNAALATAETVGRNIGLDGPAIMAIRGGLAMVVGRTGTGWSLLRWDAGRGRITPIPQPTPDAAKEV